MKNIKPHYFLLWLAGMVFAAGAITITRDGPMDYYSLLIPFLAFAYLPFIGLDTWVYYLTRNHPQLPGLKLVHIGFLLASILAIWICPLIRKNDLRLMLTTVGVLWAISHVALIVNLIIGLIHRHKYDTL